MAELKTQPTNQDVTEFLNNIPDERKREDSFAILQLMREVTQKEPQMWGSSIVGFGQYHYKYASGREGDAPVTGFSPRKQNLTVYIMPGFGSYKPILKKLGKYKTSAGCLYMNRLSDVHLPTLKKLVAASVRDMRKKYNA